MSLGKRGGTIHCRRMQAFNHSYGGMCDMTEINDRGVGGGRLIPSPAPGPTVNDGGLKLL